MAVLLRLLVIVPLAVVLIALAVANRTIVVLSLDPFSAVEPAYALRAPLFVIILGAVMVGVVIGGAVDWIAQGRYRRAARRNAAALKRVEQNNPSASSGNAQLPARISARN